MWTKPLRPHHLRLNSKAAQQTITSPTPYQLRAFHDYFITHLPSSSHHPDQRPSTPHHKLPREQSTPHDPSASNRPAANLPVHSRDLTVVRIPLKSAKHHFGAFCSRGQRPYNEDAFQAGTIELPAFARRRPVSVTRRNQEELGNPASVRTGDPQVFYFGVFDGHGGSECSEFLREKLHQYIEDSAGLFGLESSLSRIGSSVEAPEDRADREARQPKDEGNAASQDQQGHSAVDLQRSVVKAWRDLVGGYYRRFKPEFFSAKGGGQEHSLVPKELKGKNLVEIAGWTSPQSLVKIETVLEWAFLKADFDFIAAQVAKNEASKADRDAAINDSEVLESPSQLRNQIGGPKQFVGGSTCSVALISTPTPTPFWHPQATSTLLTAHCGDTRILLCDTALGQALPLTATHHPDHPIEAQRMRRYAATFVTDSFGEERVAGLANTRSFGDMPSKRIGVSAEPEIVRVELHAAQYSFMVLVSDGVSGQLSDQEIVDIVKEARTPEQGAQDLVSFATEVTTDGDNATALVLRLGGWERRQEGGGGSLRTKEARDFKRKEALDPRSRHM